MREALPVVSEWAIFSIYNVGIGGTSFRLLHRFGMLDSSDELKVFY